MARNRKPRKRYRAKPMECDPISLAINRVAVHTLAEQMAFAAPSVQAFDALRRGAGNREAWESVADALNVAEELAGLGIGSNLADEIDVAQVDMAQLMRRVKATGCWTLYAQELRTIDYGLELFRLQLGLCSTGEHLEALARVKRRTAAALSGAAPRGVDVITPPEAAPAAPGPHPAQPS